MAFQFSRLARFLAAGGPLQAIKIATYGDSRATLVSGVASPDMFSTDGVTRSCRTSVTNQPAWMSSLSIYRNDCVLTCDGGVSGEVTSSWNSGSRSGGKTITAIKALSWDLIVIQYGTNDIQQGINSTADATRVSVANATAANIQALITSLLATGRKVVFQTCMQRSVAGYNTTYSTDRVICCDYLNYGNGGSVQGMVPWCQAQPEYGTQLYVHDVQALTNIGGVSTGANVDTAWLGDGIHPGYYGARRIAKDFKTNILDAIYPARGTLVPWLRATGPNLIPSPLSATYFSSTLSNCSQSARTYGVDGLGRDYVEVTVTPNNVSAGTYTVQLLPDVGTSGPRTPLGGAFSAGDLIKSRVFLTCDDGSGGVSVVNNIAMFHYTSYPSTGLQTTQNGQNTQGASMPLEADIEAQYVIEPTKMSQDSSSIGAPTASSGMRLHMIFYFGITPTPFRVRWTAPEVRKVV